MFSLWVYRNQSPTSCSESSVFRHCLHPIFPGSGNPFDGRTVLDGHRRDEDEAPAGEARFGELLVIASQSADRAVAGLTIEDATLIFDGDNRAPECRRRVSAAAAGQDICCHLKMRDEGRLLAADLEQL
ncbi:MAG: hypothetical protein RIR52_2722 [Acidobacteriota bacterium]